MMFSIDFDDKIVMKKIRGAVRDNPPDKAAKIPDGAVALIQSEDLKFLAGINHNTPFIFLHHINIVYDMLMACKELHWPNIDSSERLIYVQIFIEMEVTLVEAQRAVITR